MTRLMPITAAAALLACTAAMAATQPLERFARRPQMHGVTISADGRYVAFLSGTEDDTILMTFDRTQPASSYKRVTASEPGKFDIGWCRWANATRLLCGLYGNQRGKKYAEPPYTRMFAVDADGASFKALEQSPNEANLFVARTSMRNLNMNYGAHIEKSTESEYAKREDDYYSDAAGADKSMSSYSPERQDEVIDFMPGDDDIVLLQLDDDRDSYRTVFALNIYNGHRGVRLAENPPIQNFVTDGRGNPRIGWGSSEKRDTRYYARLAGEREWRTLGATDAFSVNTRLYPIAMAADANAAYALGNHQGRDALWSIDLADKRDPQLLFHHPQVDVGRPVLQSDRRLLGMRYDVERPYVWYADPKLRELIERLDRNYTRRVHEIVDSSEDMKTLVIKSTSDVDEATYYIYEMEKDKLQRLGMAYPELDPKSLGAMTNILYKAKDGTEIPGYITVPSGAERKNLPLIVMPHDGPAKRDSWEFSYLRTFLANRGYAVLQMNYRGSTGFGQQWRIAAHRDWGGIAYSDIEDATRWAVSEGIADPKRICILGSGFGGYAALLGAARNSDLYRCAVSLGGIADLELQKQHAVLFGDAEFRRAQIGSDKEKLKRDSPLQNVAAINIPVLLVHGTKDWQVQVDHSKAMAKALDKADKPHELVIIKGAGHDFETKSERLELLQRVEGFLSRSLGAGA
jgi:dipeptidyl aminopeptidase/acylaminoacyl peptidase